MDPSLLVAQITGVTMTQTTPQFSAGYLAFILITYVYAAVCLMMIAKKANTPGGWMAWIPILNAYLMCKIAGKPGWWLILFLIPIVNLVVFILVAIELAKAVGKPVWAGVLLIIPVVNFFAWGYLAFAGGRGVVSKPTPTETPPVTPPTE